MIGAQARAVRTPRNTSRAHSVAAVDLPRVIDPLTVTTTAMGGRLAIHLDAGSDTDRAQADANRTIARIRCWAERLSRHLAGSELSLLNVDPRSEVRVGPTLAATLAAGREAIEISGGVVDCALLDARLAAEGLATSEGVELGWTGFGGDETQAPATRSWTLTRLRRGGALVGRTPGTRFDLGGIAKGWIAARALRLLGAWPSAIVDADGDLAVRAAPGRSWRIGVDDPRTPGAVLAVLELSAPAGGWPRSWGIATSGTSVHRWTSSRGIAHHLIDPRTGRSAITDVVQATVVCGSAVRAESLAKTAVIAGSLDGLATLERARVAGAIVLTERDDVLALPSTLALLAPDRAA